MRCVLDRPTGDPFEPPVSALIVLLANAADVAGKAVQSFA
jgi:hypothetical protein